MPDSSRSAFDPDFLDALEGLTKTGWSGRVWRATIGDSLPLRPNIRGARWNSPGIEALYCSLTEGGARAEIDHLLRLQPREIRVGVRVKQLEVSLRRILDLSNADSFKLLGHNVQDVLAEDTSIPQNIGRAASWLGVPGLLVPSARHAGTNLVVFTNALAPEDRLDLSD